MSANQHIWAQLQNTLEQDLSITQQLLSKLQQERTALETRDYSLFQQIVAEKQSLLSQLEEHISQRQQWFNKAGFSNQANALNSAKQQAPQVAAIWHELEQQWTQCQELNEINEQIASRTRVVVNQVLDTLRGQSNQQRLYTDKGDTQTSSCGRTISNA